MIENNQIKNAIESAVQNLEFDKAKFLAKQYVISNPENNDAYQSLSNLLYFKGDYWKYKRTRLMLAAENTYQIKMCKTIVLPEEWTCAYGHLTLIGFIIRAVDLGLYPNVEIIVYSKEDNKINHPIVRSYGDKIIFKKHECADKIDDLYKLHDKETTYFHSIELWPLNNKLLTLDEAISHIINCEIKMCNGEVRPICKNISEDYLPSWFNHRIIAIHNRYGYTHGYARTGRNTNPVNLIELVNQITSLGYTAIDIDGCLQQIEKDSFIGEHPSFLLREGIFENLVMRSYALLASSLYFIGAQSGPLTLRHSFGKSFILANNTSAMAMSGLKMPYSFMMPKVWVNNNTQLPVEFESICKSPMGWFEASRYKNYQLHACPTKYIIEALKRQIENFEAKGLARKSFYSELEIKFSKHGLISGNIGSLTPNEEYISDIYKFN